MIRLFTLLVGLMMATTLQAKCNGTDLSHSLTADETAAIAARLDGTPFAEGNHWIARKGDEELHLIGTMHLGDARLDGPAARLTPVVESAALLLLESNAADQGKLEQAMAADPNRFMLKGQTLPDLMSPEDWTALSAALEARGMPAFMGARMQPFFLSMMLGIPACMKDAMAEKNGLDFRLERAAEEAGVPTQSLEAFDTVLTLFDTIPMDTQLTMIRASLAPSDVNEDLFETVLTEYFAEQHSASQITLEEISPRLTPISAEENETLFTAMDGALVHDRNAAWIPVMLDALDRTEGTVVAAVGAAHLGGEKGVLNLLAQQGFDLERATF